MDATIALLLLQDGVAKGTLYALMALGIVLVFNVTRIALVPYGDLVAYATLTLASLQSQTLPGTVWLVLGLIIVAVAMDLAAAARSRNWRSLRLPILLRGVLPLAAVTLTAALSRTHLPAPIEVLLTVIIILPIGPLLYRIVFQPIVQASILTLLMVAVALHFVLSGLALLVFGPEGVRTRPFLDGGASLGPLRFGAQELLIIAATAACTALLYIFFRYFTRGKALRATAVNRIGARLVGIRTATAGSIAFLLAGAIACLSGILIGPVTTIFYDTGFLVGLKGFVGSVVGGFVSYPLAMVGALAIGLIESFASFHVSAFKEVIVFAAIIPILFWRWMISTRPDEHDESET